MPKDAKPTTPYFTDDYWKNPSKPAINIFDPGVPFGVPFAPTPFRVTFHVHAGSADVTKELPIQYRYVKDIYIGDKRMELNVVPAFSVRMTPPLAVIPAPAAGAAAPVEREIHVAVTNGTKGAADSDGVARTAGRLDGDAGDRADRVRARRRVAVRALSR